MVAVRGQFRIVIPCEDLPMKSSVGIWLYGLGLSEKHLDELSVVLKMWSNSVGRECEIWIDKNYPIKH